MREGVQGRLLSSPRPVSSPLLGPLPVRLRPPVASFSATPSDPLDRPASIPRPPSLPLARSIPDQSVPYASDAPVRQLFPHCPNSPSSLLSPHMTSPGPVGQQTHPQRYILQHNYFVLHCT